MHENNFCWSLLRFQLFEICQILLFVAEGFITCICWKCNNNGVCKLFAIWPSIDCFMLYYLQYKWCYSLTCSLLICISTFKNSSCVFLIATRKLFMICSVFHLGSDGQCRMLIKQYIVLWKISCMLAKFNGKNLHYIV